MNINLDEYMTPQEAARTLGMNLSAVYRAANATPPGIQSVKIGGRLMLQRKSVADYRPRAYVSPEGAVVRPGPRVKPRTFLEHVAANIAVVEDAEREMYEAADRQFGTGKEADSRREYLERQGQARNGGEEEQ